ncbi:hypothetical protein PCANB_002442 [Pneumocystis canis]|nr:hypothetical protein PCANB_002442 [Pneumocystis canis]
MQTCYNTPRQLARFINGQHVEIFVQGFLDCILVIITIRGSVSEWISISLNSVMPILRDPFIKENDELPLLYLSPKFLLGTSHLPYSDLARMYASQIATKIVRNSPQEQRTVLVGLGLDWKQPMDAQRHLYSQIMEMLVLCKVW